jgi:putative glutamine amidotransferase
MQDFALCEIDSVRDTLELNLIEQALERKMPILAVCRGMQILNVYYGGTLITDIPSYKQNNVGHRCENKDECFHKLRLTKSKTLEFVKEVKNPEVNTNHHQAVDELVEDFTPWAYTEDGIIEAYEWRYPENRSFIIAVQWHPERLSSENPELSDSLGYNFLREVAKFRKSKKK